MTRLLRAIEAVLVAIAVATVVVLVLAYLTAARASDRASVAPDVVLDVRIDGQSRTIARVTDPTTGTVCYLYGSTGISCLAPAMMPIPTYSSSSLTGPRP